MNSVWQDPRYAARSLRASRGYAMWVIGSLAIGMAVPIAALALLNALLLLPFPEVMAHGWRPDMDAGIFDAGVIRLR